MPLLKAKAVILRSRKWGDADRIVTCYARNLGKCYAVARGARRPKSRFGAALEPFSLCHVNMFEKPGDSLLRISQIDLIQSFQSLREDLNLMASAARMVNLVAAVTPDRDPDPGLFDILERGLASLHGSEDPSYTTLLFQVRLLGLIGFRPQTDHCAACGKLPAGDSQFSPTAGGLVCPVCAVRQRARCFSLSRGSLAFLRQVIRFPPEVLTRLRATGLIRREVEEAIEGYVTVVAGKRLPPVDFLSYGLSV